MGNATEERTGWNTRLLLSSRHKAQSQAVGRHTASVGGSAGIGGFTRRRRGLGCEDPISSGDDTLPCLGRFRGVVGDSEPELELDGDMVAEAGVE